MANRTEFHTEDNIYRVVPAQPGPGYSISVYNKNMSAWIGERGWYKTKKLAIEAAKEAAIVRTHNPAARIGTARPKRKSAATHAAPSKRLVRRRKANVKQGYFPNPIVNISHRPTRTTKQVAFGGRAPFVVNYAMSKAVLERNPWLIAFFANMDEAFEFAEWWSKRPGHEKYFVEIATTS